MLSSRYDYVFHDGIIEKVTRTIENHCIRSITKYDVKRIFYSSSSEV
jgi:hypothetical protein